MGKEKLENAGGYVMNVDDDCPDLGIYDAIDKLDSYKGLVFLLLDLAEEIASKTGTEIDDKTIGLIRKICERVFGED